MTNEIWKPVTGYEGLYEVSSLGRIKRIAPGRGAVIGRILKPALCKNNGYLHVALFDNGVSKSYTVHRLVCIAFHGDAGDSMEIAHGDGVRTNNYASNLRWASREDNQFDRNEHGTSNQGSRHGMAKLTEDAVIKIRLDNRTTRIIADEYSVSPRTIRTVKNRTSWKHV